MKQEHLPAPETLSSNRTQNAVATPEAITGAEAAETAAETTDSEMAGDSLSLEAQKYRRSVAKMLGGVIAFSMATIVLRAVLGRENWEALLPAQYVVPGSLAAMLLFSLFAVRNARKPRQYARALAAQTANQTDIRSVGALVDALSLDDGKTHEIAIAALTHMLPQLTESDADALSSAQRAKLNRLLLTPIDSMLYKDVRALLQPASAQAVAFRVAILQAWERIGDEKALATVEQLASQTPSAPGEKRIYEAAVACLPALKLRVALMQDGKTLLRASQAPPDDPNSLLRPVESDQDAPRDNLLRPSEAPSTRFP